MSFNVISFSHHGGQKENHMCVICVEDNCGFYNCICFNLIIFFEDTYGWMGGLMGGLMSNH